jgi:hypothetical protein
MGTINPPQERRCTRCDRVEVWDDERMAWVAKRVEGTKRRGTPHCVHEWDITGNYSPLTNDA